MPFDLSLGVQSFDPGLLAKCGREHDVNDIEQVSLNFKATGFDNFSLDLMYGLPEQSLQIAGIPLVYGALSVGNAALITVGFRLWDRKKPQLNLTKAQA